MALSYVGGTTGVGTSNGYTVSLSGTLTGGSNSSPSAGDVVVVFSGFGNTASSAPAVSGNTSGTYLAATAAQHVNDTWDVEFRSFYQLMGSTPDTTLTITRTTNTAYGGGTTVQVWRGADPTTPFIGAATPASGGNGNAINPPSYNPAVTGAVVIAGGAGTLAAAAASGYTAMTGSSNLILLRADGSTADIGLVMGSYTYAGSAIDPAAATGATTSTSAAWAGVTLALRPVPPLDVTITPTGSVAFSGTFDPLLERAQVPSGSVSFSGASALLRERLSPVTGSVVYSGTAAITFVPAPTSATYTIVPTGSVTFSGEAGLIQENVFPASGTVSFAGSAGFVREHVYVLSGGMDFSGAVSNNYIRAVVPTGSIYFSGTAPIDGPLPPAALFSSWRSLTGSGL